MNGKEIIDDATVCLDKPGNIVGKNDAGIVLKTGDSMIRLTRHLDDTLQEMDWLDFKVGQKFGKERDEASWIGKRP